MTCYQNSLLVDFGEVGHWFSKSPFIVRLDACGLNRLINDAQRGMRIYELSMIQRPGDVWKYVLVELVEAPDDLKKRVSGRWLSAKPRYGDHPWPENHLPILTFDKLFCYCGDDTDPVDENWLGHRYSNELKAFADLLLTQVQNAKWQLGLNDPLKTHELELVRQGRHRNDYLDAANCIQGFDAFDFGERHFGDSFYQKAIKLLRDQRVMSVAWRGDGDYELLRILCAEQRNCANRLRREPSHSLLITALVGKTFDVTSWGSEVRYFQEGIGYGDLWIEQNCQGIHFKELMESDSRAPGRYILSVVNEIDIDGFSKETGDGWTLFTRNTPFESRYSLTKSAIYLSPRVSPVLSYEHGNGRDRIYSHERMVFVVAGARSADEWASLAIQLARLERLGVQVTIAMPKDEMAFAMAACNNVIPLSDSEDSTGKRQFDRCCQKALVEADVIILVDTTEVIESEIQSVTHSYRSADDAQHIVAIHSKEERVPPIANISVCGDAAQWLERSIVEKQG